MTETVMSGDGKFHQSLMQEACHIIDRQAKRIAELEAENERLRRVLGDCLQWHKAHCSSRVGMQEQIEQALKDRKP